MATIKYNKSEIMKVAHILYREFKRYGQSFGYSLKQAWIISKATEATNKPFAKYLSGDDMQKGTVILHSSLQSSQNMDTLPTDTRQFLLELSKTFKGNIELRVIFNNIYYEGTFNDVVTRISNNI